MNFYEQIFSRGRATGEGMTHFERLFAAKFGGPPPPEVREYTGPVPVTITADGTPLLDYLISGNTTQSGTPTPDNPIMPQGTGDLETNGTKAGQYKIPISSASTTTPVYLGEVQTTRKIEKTVLDGTETTWTSGTVQGRMNFNWKTGTRNPNGANVLCTHYKSEYAVREGVCFITSNYVSFIDSNFQSLDDFKNFLADEYAAGTPVTVWYVLNAPETAVVNEPLMRIGDYADTLSKEQAGVTIPTNNGSTTVDVDTTVKPSEMYIKYMG